MGELSEPPFRGIVEYAPPPQTPFLSAHAPDTPLPPPRTTQDALLLLEAARRGIIPRVSRRFTEKERALIQSGAIFVSCRPFSILPPALPVGTWRDGLRLRIGS